MDQEDQGKPRRVWPPWLAVVVAVMAIIVAIALGVPRRQLLWLVVAFVALGSVELLLSSAIKKRFGESVAWQGLLVIIFTIAFLVVSRLFFW